MVVLDTLSNESVAFDLDKIAKEHPAPVATPPNDKGGGTKTADGKVVQTNTVVVNGGAGESSGPGLERRKVA